ncbi:MAG: adenine deaminase [Bathelium mastoideum]|nr:MAG: adenine deaminase [Bathelium mastoideum]
MCQSAFHSFLRALPKCEHHMHLEGALTPALLFQLALRNDIQLPADDPAYRSHEALLARYSRFTSLDDFLQYYYFATSVLIHEADFEALAWDYFQHASRDGVVHAEVFFDPQAHLARGITYSTVLSGFTKARERAKVELGITSELICCFLRHLPSDDCMEVFTRDDVQASFESREVIGIGLDSSEKGFPPSLFKQIYSRAKAKGLHLTAHAGEEGPAEYIQDALDHLDVERIDHGIRLVEDTDLMQHVQQSGTMLSVCPLSNVVLRCVGSVKDVPIRTFLDKGVKFSINSDDPAYFGGYVLENYCQVQAEHNLSINHWETISKNAIEGSWCNEERKEVILSKLAKVITDWQGKLNG